MAFDRSRRVCTSASASVLPVSRSSAAARVVAQTFGYDWLGNVQSSTDNESLFYDRSLGNATYGSATAGPNQLLAASGSGGSLQAHYDEAGNLAGLEVSRNAKCESPENGCGLLFRYEWDEVGQLVRARRWDVSTASSTVATQFPYPSRPMRRAAVDVSYVYDSQGTRVLRASTHFTGETTYNAEVFSAMFGGDVHSPSTTTLRTPSPR